MKENLVSVIIPTYKRAERLASTIKSVLNQSYENIEIIVVDDNNSDDQFRIETETIMYNFRENTKVKYIQHLVNSNGSVARNTGIKNSSGEFICFLDDDDFFYKDKIEKQLNFLLEENLDAVCVGFEYYNGSIIYKRSLFNKCTEKNVYDLLSGNVVFAAGSTLMLRKECFIELDGFNESYVRHQDWEFLMRIFDRFKFGVLNEYLVGINTDGLRNYPNPNKFLETKKKFLNEFENDIFKLSKNDRRDVFAYQWSEVMVYFFRDKQVSEGLNLYFNKIVLRNKRFELKQFSKGLYYYLENYLSFLKRIKYKLLKK